MHDQLKERIQRKLDALSDERGYQLLDYVEFLESKYAERAAGYVLSVDRAPDLLVTGDQ